MVESSTNEPDLAAAAHWFQIALGDLRTALAIQADESIPKRNALVLGHQAAEKALKALLAPAGLAVISMGSIARDRAAGRPRPARVSEPLTGRATATTVRDMTITRPPSTASRSRITTQGQITVPKAVRDALRVGPGDELEFEPAGDGYLVRPRHRRSILEFAGIAGRASARIPATADELDRTIEEGMATEAVRRQRTAAGAPRAR